MRKKLGNETKPSWHEFFFRGLLRKKKMGDFYWSREKTNEG